MDIATMLTGEDTDWISTLPGYQRKTIDQFLSSGMSVEDAAAKWLTAAGPANTFSFGTTKSESPFYDKLVEEVRAFLCGSDRYNEEREKLSDQFEPAHAYIVGGISVAISPALGTAAPIIAPAVALTLLTVGRITLNAWCAMEASSEAS